MTAISRTKVAPAEEPSAIEATRYRACAASTHCPARPPPPLTPKTTFNHNHSSNSIMNSKYKLPTPTVQERIEVDAFRALVRKRPGYHLARAWIGRRVVADPKVHYPTPVERICWAIRTSTGAKLEDATVIVALEDGGHPITGIVHYYRDHSFGGEVKVDERAWLDVVRDLREGGPPPPRFQVWSDDRMETLQ